MWVRILLSTLITETYIFSSNKKVENKNTPFKHPINIYQNLTFKDIIFQNNKTFTSIKLNLFRKLQSSRTFVFSIPRKQIYFTLMEQLVFTYSVGLVLRALKTESRSLRRQSAGVKLYFLFLRKKIKNLNDTTTFVLIRSLRMWGILKRFYSQIVASRLPITIIINSTFNYKQMRLKKITSIKRRLRKRYVVE